MMYSLHDLAQIAPILIITGTALLVLIIDALVKGKPNIAYWLSLLGIAAAIWTTLPTLRTGVPVFGRMILSGGFAGYCTIVFLSAGFLTVLLSRGYLEKLQEMRGEYYVLILFAMAGMILMASSLDLIITFLGIELMSICLYVLAGFRRRREKSNEAAIKYFLLGAFATGFLLYGIALVYGSAGTTNLIDLNASFAQLSENTLFLIGVVLLLVAFSFKIAAVPFHMWAPDVYEGAPTTVTAFMSTGAKAAAFSAFVAVFLRSFELGGTTISQILAVIAAASMIVGNISAIVQNNLKRLLAYSSIAHAGYMLTGIAAANREGEWGVLFYLAAYTFMNLGAFGIISWMEKDEDRNLTFDDYAGLSAKRPAMAALMSVFMFSLAGIPPFAGFFGKYYVFLAAVKANMVWLAIIGVLTSLVSVYYYLRLVVVMYFSEGSPDSDHAIPYPALVAISLAAFLVVALGLYPSVILDVVVNYFKI